MLYEVITEEIESKRETKSEEGNRNAGSPFWGDQSVPLIKKNGLHCSLQEQIPTGPHTRIKAVV